MLSFSAFSVVFIPVLVGSTVFVGIGGCELGGCFVDYFAMLRFRCDLEVCVCFIWASRVYCISINFVFQTTIADVSPLRGSAVPLSTVL